MPDMKATAPHKTEWTPQEFADCVGCSRSQVYKWCRLGIIGEPFGNGWLLREHDFVTYKNRGDKRFRKSSEDSVKND